MKDYQIIFIFMAVPAITALVVLRIFFPYIFEITYEEKPAFNMTDYKLNNYTPNNLNASAHMINYTIPNILHDIYNIT
jgi:hypothetical protein